MRGGRWKLVDEIIEIESGKSDRNRPALQQALDACRRYRAKLIISRLDRLSRDPVFLLSLRDAGIDFVAVDMPNANRMTVGIMALVAEQEREAISQRTRAALAARRPVACGSATRSRRRRTSWTALLRLRRASGVAPLRASRLISSPS